MKIAKMSLVMVLTALMVWLPLTSDAAVVACSSSGCTTFQNALNNNTLSTAVVNDTAKSWASVFNAEQTGTLTTTQLSEAKANLQTFFDYLNGEGFVDYMNRALAAVRSNLTTNGITPTESQVTAEYNALIAQGMAVTKTQVQETLTVTPTQAQQIYAQIDQAGGWSGIETQTVQAVSNVVTTSGGGRPVLEEAVGHPDIGRLVSVAFCEVAAEAYAIVSVYGAITSAFIPPAIIAVGIIGIAFGALSIFGVC